MAYTKNEWRARQGTGLNRFLKTQETAEAVTLANEPLSITVPGTPFSEENMNHIEQGIEDAHVLIEEEAQSRQQGDEALGQAIEEALEEAKNYTNEAQLATQTWLRAVNTKAELPSGLNNKINYLCRVIADPSPENNGVYQAIAGWTSEPQWTFFSDNADWIDEIELDDAISEHNESGEAHEDIREALSVEKQARLDAVASLQERMEALAPDGLDNLPQLFAQEAQARQNGDAAIIEQLAGKAPIASPTFTGTPKVPSKTSAASSSTSAATLIATEAQVALKANIASPTFTGTVRITDASGVNNRIAVVASASSASTTDLPVGSYILAIISDSVSSTTPVLNSTTELKITLANNNGGSYSFFGGSGSTLAGTWRSCGALGRWLPFEPPYASTYLNLALFRRVA